MFFERNKKNWINVEFTHGQSEWIARKAKQATGTQEATNLDFRIEIADGRKTVIYLG
jgi:hypothetical protein